jgi:hypothetical protein
MGWLDDVSKAAEAVGASVEDAAKKAGDWVQREGIPSLDNAARSVGQWGENEALPVLRDSVDTIGSWAENEALPFIQRAALDMGQWIENDVQPHISEVSYVPCFDHQAAFACSHRGAADNEPSQEAS